MAKSKSFFGLRRGSTKSLTFSVYEGQQVTKDRVTEVKNPRTTSQMQQRMVMGTALNMYSAGKEIFDHSFEGVTYGAKSMNKFLSENCKLIRESVDAENKNFAAICYGNKAAVPGLYKVSEGSLGAFPAGSKAITADGIKITVSNAAEITVGILRGMLGLNVGDYFTAVMLTCNPKSDYKVGNKTQGASSQFSFARIYVPAGQDETVITAENFATLFEIEKRNILNVTASVTESAGTHTLNIIVTPLNYSWVPACGAVIKSSKQNGVWCRSTETCFMNSSYWEDSMTSADAFTTWPQGASYVLNGGDVE